MNLVSEPHHGDHQAHGAEAEAQVDPGVSLHLDSLPFGFLSLESVRAC